MTDQATAEGESMERAVSFNHLFWVEADTDEEAIVKARERLAELDEGDIMGIADAFSVVDRDDF